ncbi:MAG: TIGR02391 family protein [Polyangiales bacterium]
MGIPVLPENIIDKLAHGLEDARTHNQLSVLFERLGFVAPGNKEGPRWFRIQQALLARQIRDRSGNNVGAFIEAMLAPVYFAHDPGAHQKLLENANVVLAFVGLRVGDDGKLVAVAPAKTISEAQERAARLRSELERRRVHAEVLRFCQPEFLEQNYFHAVLEATKSVAQKIRDKSGLTADGGELAQQAFGGLQPPLAVNTLTTDTERSEQRGFTNILVGMFGTFRNVTAHGPKVMWSVSEADALDLLSLVSYLHRRLDVAARTTYPLPSK